jgi:hypothetical protein
MMMLRTAYTGVAWRNQGVEMKAKVTEEGGLIPREMLEGIPGGEVEIRKEPGRLLVLPADDPILAFGENPVQTGTRYGSQNHDRYLYGK